MSQIYYHHKIPWYVKIILIFIKGYWIACTDKELFMKNFNGKTYLVKERL